MVRYQPKLPALESCRPMVIQKAYKTYTRIRSPDRRWLGPEDLVQEGHLASVIALDSHRSGGQKFSSHLFAALDWHMSHLCKGLTYAKRRAVGIVELDAPLPSTDESSGATVLDGFSDPQTTEEVTACVHNREAVLVFHGFVEAIRTGPAEHRSTAIEHVVRVLLFGQYSRQAVAEETLQTLAGAARRANICYAELKGCTENEETRKKLLHYAAAAVIMDSDRENKLRYLECVKCTGKFTLADVRERRYFLGPAMCRSCYSDMADDPTVCFGKPKTETREGYRVQDVECRLHCPDRGVCREISKETAMKTKAAKTEKAGAKAGKVDVAALADDLKKLDVKTATAKVAKTEKAGAKPVKAAKATKKEPEAAEDDGPKELGGVWPWRAGSAMRYVFQSAWEGITLKAFAALFVGKKDGKPAGELHGAANHDYMLKKLRSGSAGKATKTHSWKLSEDGGRLKIYDAKYLLGKKAKPAAEPEAKPAASAKSSTKKKVKKAA